LQADESDANACQVDVSVTHQVLNQEGTAHSLALIDGLAAAAARAARALSQYVSADVAPCSEPGSWHTHTLQQQQQEEQWQQQHVTWQMLYQEGEAHGFALILVWQ
jgi:hypothetical protein